nr:ABC transporter ATP-binding protein [Faecalicatena fissicatena]
MNVQSVIRVRNLYKLYHLGEETVRALDGVDFEIQKGEFCAIVGTSGSGKSTLLNMLAGLEKPTKGEVVISGCHLERMNEEQLVSFRRRRVGFIFQAYQLIASMDAEENVALPLSFRGMKKRERTLRARRMLDRVMLGKYRKHFPNQMSGGQQQRVGVARALVSDPEIIFADEPTGNLDSRTSREIMSLMQKVVREQGCTLVMVTHDPQLASWADRIIKVIDGKIVSIEVKKKESTEDEEMV